MKTIEHLFLKYYVPSVQIKGLFDIPIKNYEQIYKQNIEMGRNNEQTTGNSLDYEYFSKHYKLFAIDVSKQIQLEHLD